MLRNAPEFRRQRDLRRRHFIGAEIFDASAVIVIAAGFAVLSLPLSDRQFREQTRRSTSALLG